MAALAVLTLVWLVPAVLSFRSFILVHPASGYQSSDVNLGSRQILLGELNTVAEKIRALLVQSFAAVPASQLERVELVIPVRSLASLNSALPSSGTRDYVQARMRYPDGSLRKVKLRYRGDSLHHWGFAAKSWRVRTSRSDPVGGYRYFDIVLPRWRAAASYYVPIRAAGMMGLLASDARFVDLYINGRRHGGVYLMQERQNEAFLRRHDRMPGDIYVGDLVKEDRFRREEAYLGRGDLPWQWTKAAYNNKYERDASAPLEELMRRLGMARDRGSQLHLARLLDLDSWARLSAWMQLVAATHMIHAHNWKLYYDPGKLSFEPIVSDGNALPDNILQLAAGVPGLDLGVTTPLLADLHKDHRFLRLKARHLAEFFASGKDALVLKELEDLKTLLGPSLVASRQLDWIGTTRGEPIRYVSAKEFVARLDVYRSTVSRWFEEQRKLQLLQPDNVEAALIAPDRMRLRVSGYAAVARLGFSVSRHGEAPPRVFLTGPDGSVLEPDTASVLDVAGARGELRLPLLALRAPERQSPGSYVLRTEPAAYELRLEGATFGSGAIDVHGFLGDRIEVNPVAALPAPGRVSDNVVFVPPPRPTMWSGEVALSGMTTIDGDLEIREGTRVLMGPDANLVVRGKLVLSGRAGAPVTFARKDADRPWGAVVVMGARAKGSSLQHCSFSGGSGFVTPLAHVSGMVSFYHVENLVIDQCTFERNSGHDDLVHLVYSDARVTRSTFRNANADALDLDISRVLFDSVTIETAGNDALDLMTSQVAITGSRFASAGDKGISVGEGSTVAIAGSRIEGNAIGIQVKDGSVAYLESTALLSNGLQVSSYHKNLSYPGDAAIIADRSEIAGGGRQWQLEDGGRLFLVNGGDGTAVRETGGRHVQVPLTSADRQLVRSISAVAAGLLRHAPQSAEGARD